MSVTQSTLEAAQGVLAGQRRDWRGYLAFVGPAVIASMAYVDPGNYATNIQAGSKYGYDLLWVVLSANLVAMMFQALSAKLGIVTGRNLAELCREHFPPPVAVAMWVISEIAAMATDLAEFVGAAIGLSLLFHIPLLIGMGITGITVYAILLSSERGFRPIELIISAFAGIVSLCLIGELFIAQIDWPAALTHSVTPGFRDSGALVLAVGIVGATIMPHALYLHSGLTQARVPARNDAERRRILRISNREVVVALAIAGIVNLAILAMASAAFHADHSDVADIETAYHTLPHVLGAVAATLFLVSLLASGVASSVVGTSAGQLIMQGFVGFRIPVWVRRLVTMVPAFVIIALGVNATTALVFSQVILSLALPLPIVALVIFTSRRQLMGAFVNSRLMNVAAITSAVLILTLNLVLIVDGAQSAFLQQSLP